ncbi:putative Acid phosphatase [Helianthus anomalus]
MMFVCITCISSPFLIFFLFVCFVVLAVDEKYNEAIYSSAKRLAAAIDGLPDPGGPQPKDSKRESNFKTKEETAEKRDQFTVVVGGLLVIAFVVPMAQYYAYVSKK